MRDEAKAMLDSPARRESDKEGSRETWDRGIIPVSTVSLLK